MTRHMFQSPGVTMKMTLGIPWMNFGRVLAGLAVGLGILHRFCEGFYGPGAVLRAGSCFAF